MLFVVIRPHLFTHMQLKILVGRVSFTLLCRCFWRVPHKAEQTGSSSSCWSLMEARRRSLAEISKCNTGGKLPPFFFLLCYKNTLTSYKPEAKMIPMLFYYDRIINESKVMHRFTAVGVAFVIPSLLFARCSFVCACNCRIPPASIYLWCSA